MVQDVLGNIHDLDVLAELLKNARAESDAATDTGLETHVANVRQENLLTYRQLALGSASIWQTWITGFPRNLWLSLSDARIAATRKAMDSKLTRSLAVTRLAKRIWSQLRANGANGPGEDSTQWRILQTAARLSGIRSAESAKPKA